MRGTDLCGRIGGEEFCILVYDCEGEPAQRLANRVRAKFATLQMPSLGPDIRLTASFGVAQWRPGEGYGKLFARADDALYKAKARGRDEVTYAEGSRPDGLPSVISAARLIISDNDQPATIERGERGVETKSA